MEHALLFTVVAVHVHASNVNAGGVPVWLIGVHPPVVRVGGQVGEGFFEVECAGCLEIFLQVSMHEQGSMCERMLPVMLH